jgi:hypothetical protein
VRLAKLSAVAVLVAAAIGLGIGCAQTTAADLPKETIAINLKVQIAPEIRANVEKDLDQLFDDETEIF